MTLQVVFVGSLNNLCPAGNLSSTDEIGTLATGGSNLRMWVVWWNFVGWVSGPTVQTYPGGGPNNETISWNNRSGYVQCAFTRAYATIYTTQQLGGLQVQLNNIYLPRSVVAYDGGAVIEGQTVASHDMVSPPEIEFGQNFMGNTVNVTLVELLGNFSAESGLETAGLSTHIISAQTAVIQSGNRSLYLASPYQLNITTQYPAAWATFFGHLKQLVPSGASCIKINPVFAPFTCLNPPPGVYETVAAPLIAQLLTITVLTVSITID